MQLQPTKSVIEKDKLKMLVYTHDDFFSGTVKHYVLKKYMELITKGETDLEFYSTENPLAPITIKKYGKIIGIIAPVRYTDNS